MRMVIAITTVNGMVMVTAMGQKMAMAAMAETMENDKDYAGT